jgi:hypothetical protein
MGLGRNILYPDIPVKIQGSCTTAISGGYNDQKQKSDISNKKYYEKKFSSDPLKCYNWDLKRWLDNRWESNENPV